MIADASSAAEYLPTEQEAIDHMHAELDYDVQSGRYDAAPKQPSSEAGRKHGAARAKQRGLGFDGHVLKETIIRKLVSLDRFALAEPLSRCHTQQIIKLCNGCRSKSIYYNRCENFYCPCCAGRLARDRRKSVEWWAKNISQPKHVVLTARNTETITRKRLDAFKRAFANLRRKKFAKNWRGGFYGIEVTNEGKGWHLHLHALVDARYIDSGKLATEWAKCIGQDFAIVKVRDARGQSYLQEVCKYVVKGGDMAAWPAEQIVAYIEAFKGARCFGVFGVLYKLRAEHRDWFEQEAADKNVCPCGCTEFRIFSEAEWEWFEVTNGVPDDGFTDHRPKTEPSPGTPFLL